VKNHVEEERVNLTSLVVPSEARDKEIGPLVKGN